MPPYDVHLFNGLTRDRFLQMSGMTLGSMIEADSRLRRHEMGVRRQKLIARDHEVWRRYQEDYLDRAAAERIETSK